MLILKQSEQKIHSKFAVTLPSLATAEMAEPEAEVERSYPMELMHRIFRWLSFLGLVSVLELIVKGNDSFLGLYYRVGEADVVSYDFHSNASIAGFFGCLL